MLDYSETAITVRFAGGVVGDFPYLRSYLPILGEQVLLAANGSAWTVIDGLAGMPPENPVVNPGFEASGSVATGWSKTDLAGATTLGVAFADPPAEGVNAGEVSSVALNVDTVLQSNAIQVQSGDHWSADCLCRVGAGGNPGSVIMILMLTWYANATNLYPTTAAADSIISIQELPTPQNVWSLMRMFPGSNGGFVVPAAASHMRVAIRCQGNDVTQVAPFLVDRVIARDLDAALT